MKEIREELERIIAEGINRKGNSWGVDDIVDYILSEPCLKLLADLFEVDESKAREILDKEYYENQKLEKKNESYVIIKYRQAKTLNQQSIIKVKRKI